MSMKFRLFASVAAPILSLPLMIQPVSAMPRPDVEAGSVGATVPGIIQVQDKPLLPPSAQAQPKGGQDEEQKPRAPKGAPDQGSQKGAQDQGSGERPQRRQQADQNQGGGSDRQRPPAQQDAGQGQGERPQRRQQADQNQSGSDRQKPSAQQNVDPRVNQTAPTDNRRQQADQNQGGSDRQRPPAQQNADPGKGGATPVKPPAQQSAEPGKGGTAPAKPATQQSADPSKTAQPPAAGGNRPQQADQNQNATDPRKPATQQNADPGKGGATPAKPATQQSADPGKGTQPPAAGGNRPQQADQNPTDPRKPPTQQNADPAKGVQPPAQQNADPGKGTQPPAAGGNRPQQADQNQNPNDPRRQPQQNADQPQSRDRQPMPGQPPVQQPGQPPSQQNADQNQRGNDRKTVNPGATREQADTRPQPRPETPRTPEQVERAKQLAKDPRAARDNEKVVLPVENGAAVLDSAKEDDRPRRDGDRPRRPPPQQADQRDFAPPRSDADAQAGRDISRQQRDQWRQQRRELAEERGERLDARPQFERPRGWDYRDVPPDMDRDRDRDGRRVIISIDNETYVRHDDSRRFYDENRGARPQYERLRDGQVREVITRDDGTRIVTVRNRYGEIVQRSRVVRGGDEYVLYYAPELVNAQRDQDYVWRDPGEDLPPMRLSVPVDDYIIDTSSQPNRDYYQFLEKPPVERVERVYTLDEVRYSARIRDKVPRIDLDTVTFATGSAEIPMNQASSLRQVADAINKVLQKDPSETFLIEGHTDAVGSDESNLVLSDERAESVARVLTDAFNIPPENLSTQGYGERYLKVRTDGPSQENRRVTIRRITSLVKPVASNQ